MIHTTSSLATNCTNIRSHPPSIFPSMPLILACTLPDVSVFKKRSEYSKCAGTAYGVLEPSISSQIVAQTKGATPNIELNLRGGILIRYRSYIPLNSAAIAVKFSVSLHIEPDLENRIPLRNKCKSCEAWNLCN